MIDNRKWIYIYSVNAEFYAADCFVVRIVLSCELLYAALFCFFFYIRIFFCSVDDGVFVD